MFFVGIVYSSYSSIPLAQERFFIANRFSKRNNFTTRFWGFVNDTIKAQFQFVHLLTMCRFLSASQAVGNVACSGLKKKIT